ncbi:hypothetical protein G6F43_008730 [Rhizopus delemar]|nr:hypothetical protein G6F43_008730 [Rhizopus delemar]
MMDHLIKINYKQYVLWISCLVYIFEQYLSFRQLRLFLIRDRPDELADIVTKEEFKKSQAYNLEESYLGFIMSCYKQAEMVFILHYDILPLLWHFCSQLHKNELVQSALFLIFLKSLLTVTSLPFKLYGTFVIEERHGFNKQTIKFFLIDQLKSQLVNALLMVPFVSAFFFIVELTGDRFYLYAWITMILFQLFFITVYPAWVQPAFNTLTPLEEGELKASIEALAARVHFPLKKIYVMDGSKRSTHSNAYFYGFGNNQQIVLFDTLLTEQVDEICAVLAHELGHWQMSHTLQLFMIQQLHIFFIFWLFSRFVHNPQMITEFGFSETPAVIGFMLFQFIYFPVDSIVCFLQHAYKRRIEYQADAYALGLEYSDTLRSALIKMSVKNLGGLIVDPWYSAWNHSHPSLIERLDMIGVKPALPVIKEKKTL